MRKTTTRYGLAVLIAAATFATAGHLQAQVAWESPLLAAPRPPSGLGLHLGDPYGGDIAFFGTYRPQGSALEFRVGIADGNADDDVSALLGLSFGGLLATETREMPFDLSWVTGVGVGIGDFSILTIPLGISAGHTFQAEGFTFTPYVTPRLVLDAALGEETGDDTDLGFVFDIGIDFGLRRGFDVRFGASLGDHEAVSIGIVF